MAIGELLEVLGNSTRREILFLLSERPRFVSELADRLHIGRKAIIDHLRMLERAGLVESVQKPLSQGRPRKYYEIRKELFINLSIAPGFVDFSNISDEHDIEELDQLDLELDELEAVPEVERRITLSYIINKLEKELEETEARWVKMQKLLNRARKLMNY